MDPAAADLALLAILGRGADFVGGIDNEALDFSQLEAFINSEGVPTAAAAAAYFSETLSNGPSVGSGGSQSPVVVPVQVPTTVVAAAAAAATTTAIGSGKLLAIVGKRQTGAHALPDSPPDSSSEHPYSPSDASDPTTPTGPHSTATATPVPSVGASEHNDVYHHTSLTHHRQQQLHPAHHIHQHHHQGAATSLLNPLLGDTLILDSHIVVAQGGGDSLGGDVELHQDALLTERLHLTSTTSSASTPDHLLIEAASGGYHPQHPSHHFDDVGAGSDAAGLQSGELTQVQIIEVVGASGDISTGGGGTKGGSAVDGGSVSSLGGSAPVYTDLQNAPKKRKLSQDHLITVKTIYAENCSPSQLSPPDNTDDDYAASESCLSDSQYQCIRFQPFQQTSWYTICDRNLTEVTPHYRVDADKGFNFSNADDAFVCQKKNHFQITAHVQIIGDAQFVKTPEGLQKISSFHLHFYGVKFDCPTQTIRVEQSQSDRSKKPFHPVLLELINSQVTKVTVGRLHFSETTSNNMRKKGKPNPEQRYFQLVVGLHAHTAHGNFQIVSHASQKIIVRASNPGQFESDVELCWQKGQTGDSIFHGGKVGINTDRPDESLVVHGNIKLTGQIIQPSDGRAKANIVECDPADQLRNVQRLRVVRYDYAPEVAAQLHRPARASDTGVIAQEVAEILPEAVSSAGHLTLTDGSRIDNFLVVNKERIFMENIGAVKELCRVTDNLENRIDQLERINKRLTRLKRGDSWKSNSTVGSTTTGKGGGSISGASTATSSLKKCKQGSMGGHRCDHNHHQAHDELCSNKFIQIIIVVLVLIMAFCLMAITTLYMYETSTKQYKTNPQFVQIAMTTIGPSKTPKLRSWNTHPPDLQTHQPPGVPDYAIVRSTSDLSSPHTSRDTMPPIGRPVYCPTIVEQDLEKEVCQTYCCAQTVLDGQNELTGAFGTSSAAAAGAGEVRVKNGTSSKTNYAEAADNEKENQIVRDIEKKFKAHVIERSRRETDDWPSKDNDFDQFEDFTVIIQGAEFNTTLTNQYLVSSANYNFSFDVPISKYMPDGAMTLTFQFSETIKYLEVCHNHQWKVGCSPLLQSGNHPSGEVKTAGPGSGGEGGGNTGAAANFEDNQTTSADRINENSQSFAPMSRVVHFEIDLTGLHSKYMTYRAPLRQTQNNCKLSSTKLGLEFAEYNFHFHRDCSEQN